MALGAAEAEAAGAALLKLRAGALEGMMLLVAAEAEADGLAALSKCPTPHGISWPFNFEPSGCLALAGAVWAPSVPTMANRVVHAIWVGSVATRG